MCGIINYLMISDHQISFKVSPRSFLLGVFALFFLAGSGMMAWKLHQAQRTIRQFEQQTNQSIATTDEAIIDHVRQHVLTPEEAPTITLIQDAAALQAQQNFFVHAQNGDYLLIYTQAKKAVIYRPSIDKLVNVGPLTIKDETTKK